MAGLLRALEPAQGSKVALDGFLLDFFLRRPCRTPAPPARTAHDTARAHSELLHCLSTLPDPWPLAKLTINTESAS